MLWEHDVVPNPYACNYYRLTVTRDFKGFWYYLLLAFFTEIA